MWRTTAPLRPPTAWQGACGVPTVRWCGHSGCGESAVDGYAPLFRKRAPDFAFTPDSTTAVQTGKGHPPAGTLRPDDHDGTTLTELHVIRWSTGAGEAWAPCSCSTERRGPSASARPTPKGGANSSAIPSTAFSSSPAARPPTPCSRTRALTPITHPPAGGQLGHKALGPSAASWTPPSA